jgi:hypothetical protein
MAECWEDMGEYTGETRGAGSKRVKMVKKTGSDSGRRTKGLLPEIADRVAIMVNNGQTKWSNKMVRECLKRGQ